MQLFPYAAAAVVLLVLIAIAWAATAPMAGLWPDPSKTNSADRPSAFKMPFGGRRSFGPDLGPVDGFRGLDMRWLSAERENMS